MNQILHCDWLPERERWRYLANSGLPVVSRKKIVFSFHIIKPLLAELVRSGWLDAGLVLFSRAYDSIHKHVHKKLTIGQYPTCMEPMV